MTGRLVDALRSIHGGPAPWPGFGGPATSEMMAERLLDRLAVRDAHLIDGLRLSAYEDLEAAVRAYLDPANQYTDSRRRHVQLALDALAAHPYPDGLVR